MRAFSFITGGRRCLLERTVTVLLIVLLNSVIPGVASAERAEFASLVMDAGTGQVLQQANADLSRYPASLTKMMTLYLVFEALDHQTLRLADQLPISAHAASQPPTKIGLQPGQSISVENAILALITKSANDIAAAVAEALGGTEQQFAWMMTTRARKLGMSRTVFMNASGLPDPQQTTTARDMSILALALLHDFPQYYPYFSTQQFSYGGATHPNHNHMLGVYRGLDGIKTGYTQASGFNLVASAQQDGRRLIGVVMGARSPSNRRLIMTSLLNQAFGNERVIEVRESTSPMPTLARNERPQMVATRTTSRPSARAGSRTSSRASKRAIVSTAPTRGAARSTKTSRSAKSASSTFAMATPKPAAKAKRSASATRTLASSATSSARKAKPQLVSDVKPKAKPTVRRNKRVLVSAR